MPQRRSSSVTSFLSDLHFSGKVIMASILFGFGLLLVGAILLVIATGEQQTPPLQEDSKVKKTPMTFVGPGVMGVGAFFVIVGTIMCLFETRILRRRKRTDHDSLINSEIVHSGNTVPSSTENQDHVHEKGDENLGRMEETQIKTVHADCHIQSSAEIVEKVLVGSYTLEKDGDKELSTSAERDQASAFNTSVYVDAVGDIDNDDDGDEDEQQYATESAQFSTPPETKPEAVLKASFDGRSDKGHDHSKHPDPTLSRAAITPELTKESLLPVSRENESSLPVSKENESSLPVSRENESLLPVSRENESSLHVPKVTESPLPAPEENESFLSVPNDSNSSEILTQPSVKESDITKETPHSVHDPGSTVTETQDSNGAHKERHMESAQTVSSDELSDAAGTDSSGSDSGKVKRSSAENTNTTSI